MKHKILTLLLSLVCVAHSTALPLLKVRTQSSQEDKGAIDRKMEAAGLVDVCSLAPEIRLDLRYATTQNFTKQQLYKGLSRAYFQPKFAQRIAEAQRLLSKEHPGYHFVIFDASRPISVQRTMYAVVRDTPLKVYVANGARGGRHNYGVAVDLSIADAEGTLLDMGTDFDFFGEEAHTDQEARLVKEGKITKEAQRNRQLLRSVMDRVGLRCYTREWWHFQEKIDMPEVRKRYKLLDF